MKILALELSSSARSVAVMNGNNATVCEVLSTAPGRDMRPLTLIESVLKQACLDREAIECLGIGLGPGSYAGIRVAISLAQGWQLATGVKLIGINSVACIAAQAAADLGEGKFNVVIDAQRNEFYLAGYEANQGVAREISPLRLASLAEIQNRGQADELLIGPEVTRWFPRGQIIFPQAATLARLAQTRNDFLPGEKLEPIYLRETTFVKAPPARPLPFAL